MTVGLLHIVALVLYGATATLLAVSLARGRAGPPRIGALFIVGAVVAHALALVAFVRHFHELPLVGLAPSLSSFAFLLGIFLLPSAATRDEVRPVGLILAPIATVLLLVAIAIGIRPAGEALAFRGIWFAAHVVLAFIGNAALAVAFAAGLLYLIQFHELKSKNFGRWFRFLPSLDTLDRVGRRSLLIGFPTLTLALALAWAWTVRFRHSLAATDPKIVWSVLTWLVFLIALGVRFRGRGRDRRGAVASVVGFVVVVVAYLVLRLSVADGRLFF